MGPREREIKRRLRVPKHAEKIGNVPMTCRYFGLARSSFYHWKTEYDKHGEAGLGRKSAVSIKPRFPQLNGKVERSHRSDQEEFYPLLNYVDDRDLNKKLTEWENFYQFHRLHGAFAGRTPHEILRERPQ